MEPLQLIKLNSSGPAVLKWQQFLLQQGFSEVGVADGVFGTNTNNATKSFQSQHGLTADGIVGNNTYAAAMQSGFNAVLAIADFIGIDVSHHDGTINWSDVKADPQNIQFAYLKATEGTGFKDQTFITNRAGAATNNIPIGAYHFYHPELSPVDQAHFFCSTINPLLQNDLPPALDFEPDTLNSIPAANVIADLHTFLNSVESLSRKQPVIYTNHNSWVNVLGNPADFVQYKLWIASYGNGNSLPHLFGGWVEWAIWQYTDSGHVDGIASHQADMNKYNSNAGLI
jgi:lysozyme